MKDLLELIYDFFKQKHTTLLNGSDYEFGLPGSD